MATHDRPNTTDDLTDRVQSLPAELFNKIQDLTFAPNFEKFCLIDKNYKPPSILQVNHKWRILLSPAFYDCTIFSVEEGDTSRLEIVTLTDWLKSLTTRQCKYLGKPRLRILSKRKLETDPEQTPLPRRPRLLVTARDREIIADLVKRVRQTLPTTEEVVGLSCHLGGKIVFELPMDCGGTARFNLDNANNCLKEPPNNELWCWNAAYSQHASPIES